ncbi:Sau3AI family type II restriction endonuclease [Erysipelothrix rhusiopathiae]|nr:Sau3AI family type II restriction endonuclease [Erysipelothrix rhusiopathiae]
MGKYTTVLAINNRAKELVGMRFVDLDRYDRLLNTKNKGKLGHIVEESGYDYIINNSQKADFEEAGVELKVTPFKVLKNKKNISAKERCVLTMVNYMNDHEVKFYESHCYDKLKKIQFIFYEDSKELAVEDLKIDGQYLFDFEQISEADKEVIINDYSIIQDKIKKGDAHLISESDTFYLSACTKGETSKDRCPQVNSTEQAKPRAYSLKNSYMTELLRTKVFNQEEYESILNNDYKTLTIEEKVTQLLKPYYGMSLNEIDKHLKEPVNRDAKNYLRNYIRNMMKIKTENLNNIEEFKKSDIVVKTIRLTKNGKIREHMSFPAFNFKELSEETWDSAAIKNYFESKKFLFIVFQELEDLSREYRFEGSFIWGMDDRMIDSELFQVWNRTVSLLNKGLEIIDDGKRRKTNLPGSSFNHVVHVRTHAKNRDDIDYLPDGRVLTKHCFWLDKNLILKIIDENLKK